MIAMCVRVRTVVEFRAVLLRPNYLLITEEYPKSFVRLNRRRNRRETIDRTRACGVRTNIYRKPWPLFSKYVFETKNERNNVDTVTGRTVQILGERRADNVARACHVIHRVPSIVVAITIMPNGIRTYAVAYRVKLRQAADRPCLI